ncbi:hypothetical protein F4823DRAFT_567197 [Ustulina deusta]|nr:hypothetical protein F4823DRAFT_567197 [Ustulina deusta]
MTNLGPLTTTFMPIGPDCTSTFIGYNQHNAWIQYGAGDGSSTACLPSGFVPFYSYFYSPGVCPSGYFKACYTELFATASVKPKMQITCCPTSYECAGDRPLTDPFACKSFFTGVKTFEASAFTFLTDSEGTTAVIGGTTTEVWTDNFIHAYGPIVHITAGDITPAATSTVSLTSYSRSYTGTVPMAAPPDSKGHNPPGLSQGAVAGIAVGGSLAGVFLIGAVALSLRRRRCLSEGHPAASVSEIRAQVRSQQDSVSPQPNDPQQQQYPYELDTRPEQMQPYELNATRE